ncbi:hypothetical protein THAOC_12848 [Thalassiosira oceanica]|uniref:Uncharacterized protein n=1 Tax=Thalassiosira oceanica TaxID=159749 RepID=K0SLR6_THAOC|nr:hypothetical protein THAOC_12848 [Thalassiosira oceanica]|eukprot:EJK66245.1 hypothetical protein THAOC_12848 [Thalassiosira oceanica]
MIASNIAALSLILAVANGKSKLALGLNASQFDQVSQDKQVISTVDNFFHNKAGNTGKPKNLRGFDGNTNALERSSRLAGDSTGTHVGLNGAGGDDKFFAVKRMLQDCSTPSWHPQWSGGWDAGHCAFEATCNSPGYASELACCKSAYAGQTSGYCLSQLEAPPTLSPTTSDLTVNFWYPDYGTEWTSAGCLNTLPLPYNNVNDRPNYPTQLECCKAAYGGQMSGACLSQLESPPTTSPTTAGNIGSLYYPDYNTAWPDAGCTNVLPVPSGRPTYASHLACCKGAYGGQVSFSSQIAGPRISNRPISGVCLSQLDSPPTTSPTSAGGLDVYYPDYNAAWDKATCVNTRPMPSGRPVYSTMLACCKGAYAGQTSGYCASQLDSPPTTSPTSSDFTADFWYPDYSSDWSDAVCLNSLPLPFSTGGRPTYTTNAACCSTQYGGQVSKACLCSMASPPAGCWSRLMSSPTTKTAESTLQLNGVNSLPSSDSDMQALVSRIEVIVNGGLSDGAKVLSISNVSFENGSVSYKVEIGYDSSKTSEGSIKAIVGGAAESPPSVTPTSGPTGTPTQSPSRNPTLAPTVGPTQSPTGSPVITLRPTSPPTTSPTHVPTNSPTSGPSGSPSTAPTGSGPCLKDQPCCTVDTCTEGGCDNLKTGSSSSDVPCGSCNGGESCRGVDPAVLSENSCTGFSACYGDLIGNNYNSAQTSVAGDNSCNEVYSCAYAGVGTGFTTIGNNSCNFNMACYQFGSNTAGIHAVIGDGSCVRVEWRKYLSIKKCSEASDAWKKEGRTRE